MVLDGEHYQRVLHSPHPATQAVIENYRVWAGLVTWTRVDDIEHSSTTLFDTVAVYLAYSQAGLEMEKLTLSITADGLTLPDPAGYEVLAAMRWRNLPGFYDHLVERLDPRPSLQG